MKLVRKNLCLQYNEEIIEIQPDSADQNQNKSHALEVARTPTFDFEREFQSLLHKSKEINFDFLFFDSLF